jgi:hypothetical protein
MPWVRIDDHFDEHPKLAAVGPIGWGVWLAGLAYCNRNLTDGFIPYSVAEGIGGSWKVRVPVPDEPGVEQIWSIDRGSGMHGETMDTQWVIDLLVSGGLWEEVVGGYRVHDYEDYQPTKAEVLAERAAKVAAGRAGGIAAATARAKAPATAPAQAQSKPVPVPVPVSVPESLSKTPPSPPRPDVVALESFGYKVTTKRLAVLDEVASHHDITGYEWAAAIIRANPTDAIGAVMVADQEWKAGRRREADDADAAWAAVKAADKRPRVVA